jgi:hypothetical protein
MDFRGSGLRAPDARNPLGVPVRRQLTMMVDSLLGCRVDMGRCGLRVLLGVEGSSSFPGRSESRWGGQWKDEGYHMGYNCRWSRPSPLHLVRAQYTNFEGGGRETHVVSRVPSQPFSGLVVWRPREQLDQRHQQRPPSLLPIVRGSCFDFGFDCRVDGRPRRKTSLGAFCHAIGFSSRDRYKWDHRRTLLKQVHLLCFHAYYGCAQ